MTLERGNMGEEFNHRKEEYVSLRKEIESMLSELSILEKNCVLAIAAVYSWLATQSDAQQSQLHIHTFYSFIGWGVPVFIAAFGAMRAYSINKHFGVIGRYMSSIEDITRTREPNFTGWEHFFSAGGHGTETNNSETQTNRPGTQTKIRMWFWGALIVATFCIWAFSWCHG